VPELFIDCVTSFEFQFPLFQASLWGLCWPWQAIHFLLVWWLSLWHRPKLRSSEVSTNVKRKKDSRKVKISHF